MRLVVSVALLSSFAVAQYNNNNDGWNNNNNDNGDWSNGDADDNYGNGGGGWTATTAPSTTAPTGAPSYAPTTSAPTPWPTAGPTASAIVADNDNDDADPVATAAPGIPGDCPLPTDSRTLADGLLMREVVNVADGTITVELTYQGEAWLGFGISTNGGAMIGSDAVIGLPDSGSVQQYDLGGKAANLITPWNSQTLSDASIVQQDGVTTMTFTMPLTNTDGQNSISANGPNTFLYAYGSSNDFGYHGTRASFTIDAALQTCDIGTGVTPPYDVSADASNVGGGAAANQQVDKSALKKKLWKAHGLLMSISWGILLPIAIGCSVLRDALGSGGTWFVLHSNINTLVFVSTTIGFAIAVYILSMDGISHFSNGKHNVIGLIVFIMVTLQVLSGWFRPHLPKAAAVNNKTTGDAEAGIDTDTYDQRPAPAKSRFRVLFEYQHRILGTALLVLTWYQVSLGISLYKARFGLDFNANAAFFGVAVAIVCLIALGKIALVVMSKR